MNPLAASREQFMSLAPAFASGPTSKSFDEVRMEDYLKSYQATGRPPAPYPTTEQERVMLKLTPPFVPHSIPITPISNPQDLPAAQGFYPTQVTEEKLFSITADPPYSPYNFEELRYYAYLSGNRQAPSYLPLEAFMPSPATSSLPTSSRTPVVNDTGEKFQSITIEAAYTGHSFEELRVAFVRAGRQQNSAEINSLAPATASSAPTVVPPAPVATQPSTFGPRTTSTFGPSVSGGSPFSQPPVFRS